MEYKQIRTEIKTKGDGMTIEGYASTFTKVPDSYGDIIAPGAFKKTIKERFDRPVKNGKPPDIVVLWQHQNPFGIPTKLSEDGTGLYFEAEITKTTFGREQMEYVRHGVVKQMSFGYDPIKYKMGSADDDFERVLQENKLYELSPVTFGANDETNVEAKMLKLLERRFGHLIVGEAKRVVPYQDLSLGAREARWQSTQAERRVRAWADAEEGPNEKYRNAFLWFDSENPDNFTSFKLQIGDIVDGQLVALPRAIFAVAGVLMGARGGVDIPESDQETVRRQLNRYYAKMREEFDDDTIVAPWNRSLDLSLIEGKNGRVISAANIKEIVDALTSIENGTVTLTALLAASKPTDATPDDGEPAKVTSEVDTNEPPGKKIAELLNRIKNITV